MRSANHASTVALCAATGSTVELQAATIVVIAIVIPIFITRTSTTSQKKPIQLGHRQLHPGGAPMIALRSTEHTSELQFLMPTSYAAFSLKKKITNILTSFSSHSHYLY